MERGLSDIARFRSVTNPALPNGSPRDAGKDGSKGLPESGTINPALGIIAERCIGLVFDKDAEARRTNEKSRGESFEYRKT